MQCQTCQTFKILTILAVRTVAAGHRMVADGWALFVEAIKGAGEGDLPQLLHHLRGVMTPTPPPQQSVAPTDVPPTPSPAKIIKMEHLGDQPVVVMVWGGVIHGPEPNVIWLGGQKMAATPTYGRSTQEKPLCPLQFFHIQYGFTAEARKGTQLICFILILALITL